MAFACSENKRWETVRLAEIFTISAGGDIDRQNSSPTYSTSYPYPVYANALTNNGLYGYANYFKVEGDSITVSGRGEVGHAIARHCKYVPIVRLLSLVPKYEDDVDFFAYMINATSIYIESTGVPQLTSPQLGAVKVFRPPILEQKRISSLLLKIDAKIENEERLTFYLEKIRSSKLQELFLQKADAVNLLSPCNTYREQLVVMQCTYLCCSLPQQTALALFDEVRGQRSF